MKAELDFAGQKDTGGLLYKYIPFSPRELEQPLSMYMIQGLNPSPQLKMKSKSQNTESMQGNDLVFRSIGENFDKRHKQFKRYFRGATSLPSDPSYSSQLEVGSFSKTFKPSIHTGSTFTTEYQL